MTAPTTKPMPADTHESAGDPWQSGARLRWSALRPEHRKHLLWLAALLHRLSGLGLALFLPLHFIALGLALDGEARLDGFLRWTEAPLVKLSEGVLVFLLSAHALSGLRVLAIENLAWHGHQKWLALAAIIFAAALAVLFLANTL